MIRLSAALTTLVLAAAVLSPPTSAYAASSTTCTGTTHVTYSPGLTLTPQDVTGTETDTISSCTSTDTTITGITTSPTYSFDAPGASCNAVQVSPGGGGLVIHWNNGQTSTLTGLVGVLTATGGIVQNTATGTVTAGEFNGATAVITWIYALVNPLQCLMPGGLTTQDGTIVLQVTGA
ncbi:hypothetical protein F4553_001464 [Allocatelliglobosispora scoriae]|uniref:Uncharacterized protein n=1 Tax=Allocatelliglobosispora scoriae TaxID=643052 RepID=A0A841BKB6_9ACTN|nr:hypothetical protein [Allocatelliglobosispora scoriae]MBB5868085.1 hypothetical protein [Allocatelliglobosispora scoriae]